MRQNEKISEFQIFHDADKNQRANACWIKNQRQQSDYEELTWDIMDDTNSWKRNVLAGRKYWR